MLNTLTDDEKVLLSYIAQKRTEQKVCIHCGKSKPTYSFYPDKSRRDGLSNKCRDCLKELNLNRYHLKRGKSVLKNIITTLG